MTKIMIKLPRKSEVTYELAIKQESIIVRGNAIATGNHALDKQYEDEILARVDAGDGWAWACVKVTASWRGLQGVDYLGCCTYQNEEDFKAPGVYFDNMKTAAYHDLIRQITALKA